MGSYRSLAGALVCLAVLGCSDHRISQEEFMALQQECRVVCTTTRPADQTAKERAIINRTLGPYRVGVSDVLAITLITALDQTTLSPPILVRVDREGNIMLPLVGTIKVGGMELTDVETVIRKAYVPKIYRDVAIYVDVPRPEATNVLVAGAVTSPGLVPLRRTERNLLYALVGAGGVTNMASGKVTLRRIRSPGDEITLCLSEPEDMRKALALPPLENGDMVTVHAAMPNMIFVGGLVMAPQAQAYPPGAQVTVLQALAASGGLRTDLLTVREGTLIRHMPDGTDVHVKLDLDRIQKGKDPNLTLAAGDILWVSHTPATFAEDWFNQHVYIRGGTSFSYNQFGDHNYLHGRTWNNNQGGFSNADYQNQYDPFGFLNRNNALQNLVSRPVAATAEQ